MFTKIIFIFCSLLTGYANSASTFDQRQTGEFNVQVDLKDLKIFALMKGGKEEYVDYDYAYDYSEMTIKPQNGTTPKPANGISTATSNTLITTTLIAQQTTLPTKNSSMETEFTLSPAFNDSTTTNKILDIVATEASVATDSTTSANRNTTSTSIPSNNSNCKKGFVMNQKGDCELKLHGTGNALLKLVKLSQRLKLRRENRRNSDGSTSV